MFTGFQSSRAHIQNEQRHFYILKEERLVISLWVFFHKLQELVLLCLYNSASVIFAQKRSGTSLSDNVLRFSALLWT